MNKTTMMPLTKFFSMNIDALCRIEDMFNAPGKSKDRQGRGLTLIASLIDEGINVRSAIVYFAGFLKVGPRTVTRLLREGTASARQMGRWARNEAGVYTNI